jgi:redox-sensing transcriptional repressor
MEIQEKTIKAVPEPTLRRFPKYIQLLKRLKSENIRYISSNAIADELGLDSIQVRKDLSLTGTIGKPKLGFDLDELNHALLHTLNWDNINDAFLVGAGSLGNAIMGYKNFSSYGFNIIAAFDNDSSKIGSIMNNIEILPIEKLNDMIVRMHINIGVITTPAETAQQIANLMISGGIKAIWNFAPVHLKAPEDIIIENAQLSQSLGVLTHKLAEKLKLQSI